MKCPICNGKGTQFIADYDGMYDIVCDKCKGNGELDENGKPILTNEEYLKSLDTEQLAEWFINSGFLTCTLRDCEDCKYYDKSNDDCIDGSEAINDKQMWVEWLKQPHSEVGK